MQSRLKSYTLDSVDFDFAIKDVPSDSQMREILDGIDLEPLHEAFADLWYELQRGGVLKKWVFHDGHYFLSISVTGYTPRSDKTRIRDCSQGTADDNVSL